MLSFPDRITFLGALAVCRGYFANIVPDVEGMAPVLVEALDVALDAAIAVEQNDVEKEKAFEIAASLAEDRLGGFPVLQQERLFNALLRAMASPDLSGSVQKAAAIAFLIIGGDWWARANVLDAWATFLTENDIASIDELHTDGMSDLAPFDIKVQGSVPVALVFTGQYVLSPELVTTVEAFFKGDLGRHVRRIKFDHIVTNADLTAFFHLAASAPYMNDVGWGYGHRLATRLDPRSLPYWVRKVWELEKCEYWGEEADDGDEYWKPMTAAVDNAEARRGLLAATGALILRGHGKEFKMVRKWVRRDGDHAVATRVLEFLLTKW